MSHSPEALSAFAEAAALGSFSAAARKLGKSQSTVSGAIAALEIDLGVILFDRASRKPLLTPAGRLLLNRVQDILAATDRLDRTALQLAGGMEPRLTLVVSDTYQSVHYEQTLKAFERRYPELAFECLMAEDADLLALIQSGRAQLGLVQAQSGYAPDIVAQTLSERSQIGLYVAAAHPLAGVPAPTMEMLARCRQIGLGTSAGASVQASTLPTNSAGNARYRNDGNGHGTEATPAVQPGWSAPSYLMMLEMTTMGFGWAALPDWLVKQFAHDKLVQLAVPGWPRQVQVDAVWSRRRTLGPAGGWLLERMLAQG